MKVFITGATGFIGSHVARLLAGEDCQVYALVRQGSDLWRIEDCLPSLNLIECDLRASEQLAKYLESIQPDVCFHLAWYAVPGKYGTAAENLEMLNASLALARSLASMGCARLIGIGTCFEYDTDLGYLSEDSATSPRNLYAACKLSVHQVWDQIARLTGMEVAWARLFYQYGPYEARQRLVPSVICSLLEGKVAKVTPGKQVRDFLHVEDVASAIWAVARSDVQGVVNVGSGRPVTVSDLVTRIGSILNRQDLIALGALSYNDSDPMFVCANNRLLTENTDWTPHYNLESGLRHTVEWWQRQARR